MPIMWTTLYFAPCPVTSCPTYEPNSNLGDLWELEAYLTESRKTVNRVYQFRESRLFTVFSNLMGDGRLKEGDLVGLQPDKIDRIKRGAEAFRPESEFQ